MQQPSPSPVARLRISVVIPHLNQPELLQRCLASLAAGHRQADEIVVVDNGSDQMPHAICKAAGATLLREETPGPGPARNLGVSRTTGDVLAFIDADCLADPDWLVVAAHDMADPACDVLGGDVRIAYADPDQLTMIEAYESIYAYRMDRYIAREGFTGTGNLVVHRHILEQVGPFAGLAVAEDIDWGKRATAAGHRLCYVGDMRVYHPARPSFDALWQKWDRHLAHFYTDAMAKRGGALRWALRMVLVCFSPLAEIPQIVTTDRVSGVKNRLLAFAGLIRVRLYRARVMARLLVKRDPEALANRWNRTGDTP